MLEDLDGGKRRQSPGVGVDSLDHDVAPVQRLPASHDTH